MQLTEESFRALARSSPWRWRSLHFTRRGEDEPVEAWVRRPGWMRVRTPGRRDEVIVDEPGGSSAVVFASTGGTPPPCEPPMTEPEFRADGLVERRPDPWDLAMPEDPMYSDYTWVAMLDPLELSRHTRIADLSEGLRGDRAVWRARVWAEDGYEPRCGCCPLLWSEISERDEAEAGGPTWVATRPDVVYPDGFRVALDVQTGILVELFPVGGDQPDDTIEVEIHEVDGEVS